MRACVGSFAAAFFCVGGLPWFYLDLVPLSTLILLLLNAQCGTQEHSKILGWWYWFSFCFSLLTLPSFLLSCPSQCAKQVRYDVVYPPKGACLLKGTTGYRSTPVVRSIKKKNRLPDCRLFFLLLLFFSKKKVSREEEGLNKKKKNNEMLRSLLLRFLSRIRSSLLEEREKSTLLFRSFSLINSLMMITGRVDLSVQDVGFYLTWGGRKKKGGNANGHLQEKFGKYRVNKKSNYLIKNILRLH